VHVGPIGIGIGSTITAGLIITGAASVTKLKKTRWLCAAGLWVRAEHGGNSRPGFKLAPESS
jgi:hypothetical protein